MTHRIPTDKLQKLVQTMPMTINDYTEVTNVLLLQILIELRDEDPPQQEPGETQTAGI